MNRFWSAAICFAFAPFTAVAAEESKAPGTVKALWADIDPRKDALDVKVVRESEKDGIVYRYVIYHVGTFKGKPARMSAFFGFPKDAKKLPGLLHLHGGGQRAFLNEVALHIYSSGAPSNKDLRRFADHQIRTYVNPRE